MSEEYEKITIEHLLDEKEYLEKKVNHVVKLNSIYEAQLNIAIKQLYEMSGDSFLFDKNVREKNIKREVFNKDEEEKILEDESIPKEVKSIYKKIALKTHPDKISHLDISEKERESLEKSFISAREMLESKNYEELVILSLELGIQVEESYQTQKDILNKKCQSLRQRIVEIKKLASWSWGQIEEKDYEKKCNLITLVWENLNLGVLEKHVIIDYLNFVDGTPGSKEVGSIRKPTRNKGRPKKRLSAIRREN